MFFRRRRLKKLECEVEILAEEVNRLADEGRRSIISVTALENSVKRLERVTVDLIRKTRELETKVEELSKKKISETTTEEEEAVPMSQILDEFLNGVDEE